MTQVARQQDLLAEALEHQAVAGVLAAQQLDRDAGLEQTVPGLVDEAGGALAGLAPQLVAVVEKRLRRGLPQGRGGVVGDRRRPLRRPAAGAAGRQIGQPAAEEVVGQDHVPVGVAADEAEVLQVLQRALQRRRVERQPRLERVAGRRRVVGDGAQDLLLDRRQHLEVDREEVGDHLVGGHLFDRLFEIAALEQPLADQLQQVGVVVAVAADGLDLRVVERAGASRPAAGSGGSGPGRRRPTCVRM